MSKRKTPNIVRKTFSFFKKPLVLFFIVLLTLTTWITIAGITPKLGLDLQGGTEILLSVSPGQNPSKENLDEAVNIIRQRVNGLGVAEAEVALVGTGDQSKVSIALPGVTSTAAAESLGSTAQLNFRQVKAYTPGYAPAQPENPTPSETKADKSPRKDKATRSSRATTPPSAVNAKKYPKPPTPTQDAPTTPPTSAGLEAYSCETGPQPTPEGGLYTCASDGRYELGPVLMEGTAVQDAYASLSAGTWIIYLQFTAEGGQTFGEITTELSTQPSPTNQLAAVLDNTVISAPVIQEPITGGSAQISGTFDEESAKSLSSTLRYGALPIAFTTDQVQTVSATIGSNQLKAGILSALIGLALVALYSLLYYRVTAFITITSLLAAALTTWVSLILLGKFIGYTLTLAGLAAAVIAIGITADSFVVYYERIRDELRAQKTLTVAAQQAWKSAFRTILAADAVSLTAAVVLYLTSSGSVKGFALTLGLTTLIDLLIVVVVTKPLVHLLSLSKRAKANTDSWWLGLHTLAKTETRLNSGKVNMLSRRQYYYVFSAVLLTISLVAMVYPGFKFGVEFTGGNIITVADTTTEKLENIGQNYKASVREVSSAGENYLQLITPVLNEGDLEKVQNEITEQGAKVDSVQSVGPSWGQDITKKALIGLAVFLILISVIISVWFSKVLAASALIALVHDIVLAAGIYALTNISVGPATIVGLLTVLAYSLYDTVVVFDRVKENTRSIRSRKVSWYGQINQAMSSTLIRSTNTSIIAALPVAVLLAGAIWAGSETVLQLSTIMLIGLLVGTYSSIFLAAPLSYDIFRRTPKIQDHELYAANYLSKKTGVPQAAYDKKMVGRTPAVHRPRKDSGKKS